MRILIAFILCLMPLVSFSQGVATRSLNGQATNLTLKSTGSSAALVVDTNALVVTNGIVVSGITQSGTNRTSVVEGMAFVRIISTPSDTYNSVQLALVDFISTTDGFRYVDIGAQPLDGYSQHGIINIFGKATNSANGIYANLSGLNVWNNSLPTNGDYRTHLERVKAPGGSTNAGGYWLRQTAWDPTDSNKDGTFANSPVVDNHGRVGLGYVSGPSDPSAGTTPFFGYARDLDATNQPAWVNFYGMGSPFPGDLKVPLLYLEPWPLIPVPIASSIENTGTNLFFTDHLALRKMFALTTTNGVLAVNGVTIGNGGVTLTNVLTGSATLDFASQTVGGAEDLPVTVTGAAAGDYTIVAPPAGSTTGIVGSYSSWASNGIVYVRFVSTGTAQNPASGTFKVLAYKTQ